MSHAQSFINNGGQATWQFLVFEHNQHQIDEATKLSKTNGFKNFIVKQTTRFVNKQHQFVDHVPVLDNKKIFFLKLPSDSNLVNPGYDQFRNSDKNYTQVEINCIAKRLEMIYIGADGYVFPCGFLADRLYGFEAEDHPDHARIMELFKIAGGAHLANLNYTELTDIVTGSWFNTIEKSWSDNTRLERCAHQCNADNQLVTNTYSYMRGVDA
jgi:hypothetical protein